MRVLVCTLICAIACILAVSGSLMASGGAVAGGHAQWCYRDIGAAHSRCEFPSARQCLAFAGIAGGICERSGTASQRKGRAGRNHRG